MEPDPPSEPCCFDGWASSNAKRARRKEVSASISRDVLDAIGGKIRDRSFLDLGCGAGDLALAALGRGASRATGVDLGPGAIEEATALAAHRHLGDRSSFVVGDASSVPLEPHDVVVLNRVLCCFPGADALIDHSLPVTRRIYAFTAPKSQGVVGWYNRAFARIENLWYKLRDTKFQGFRVYIHDLPTVDRRIREAGFEPILHRQQRVMWHLAVYERAA